MNDMSWPDAIAFSVMVIGLVVMVIAFLYFMPKE